MKILVSLVAMSLLLVVLVACGELGSEGCDDRECAADCVAVGFSDGMCSGGACECFGDADGDADVDADADADADADSDLDWDPPPPVTRVDVLFVIDNSRSMQEEQAELARQFEPMVRELVAPTDPGTGAIPPAVTDLHVGVVSSDMGSGGYALETCEGPEAGDAGELQDAGRVAGCETSYSSLDCGGSGRCPWLSHSTGLPDDGTDPADAPIWDDFSCVGQLGTGGCGFEQPLEASLEALTTQAAPGMPNEGFLRDDSLLVVIYVTDEDDCSTPSADLFDPDREDAGPLALRCIDEEDELYPVSRYFDGLTALRDYVGHIFVAAIAGVPVDGSWGPGDPIAALRDMRQVAPDGDALEPTCSTDIGQAYPPVRVAELVSMFGDYGYLASICQLDWTHTLNAIARRIQERLAV